MSQVVGKGEFLRRLDVEHARFEKVLAQLTAEQLVLPGPLGDWSVKDVLAHLIAHEQRALLELQYALGGERMDIDHSANDTFNAQAVLTYQTSGAADVHHAWAMSYHQIRAAVEALPEVDFAATSPLVEKLGDTVDGALANNTYKHYAEHRAQIESWLQTSRANE